MRPAKFVYMEFHGADARAAQRFYSDLFGWEFHERPSYTAPSYAEIRSGGEIVGGIAADGQDAHWLAYVGVTDIAASIAKARVLGARIEVEPRAVGELGTLSVLVDPAGARLALWQAAPVEVVRNEWGVIVAHDDLLELRWLASTSSMTDGGFMATLALFASEAEKARPKGLFIDATEFDHRFGPGVMEWRDAHIIPRYGAAGVRKFAFLMPSGFPKAGTEAVEGPAVFPTKWFVRRQEALGWLRAN
jgi:uncharacterized protein